jgi:hypothetical protein
MEFAAERNRNRNVKIQDLTPTARPGFDAHLTKPVDLTILEEILATLGSEEHPVAAGI